MIFGELNKIVTVNEEGQVKIFDVVEETDKSIDEKFENCQKESEK